MTEHEGIQEMVRQKDRALRTLDPAKSGLLIIDAQCYFVAACLSVRRIFEKLAPGAADG